MGMPAKEKLENVLPNRRTQRPAQYLKPLCRPRPAPIVQEKTLNDRSKIDGAVLPENVFLLPFRGAKPLGVVRATVCRPGIFYNRRARFNDPDSPVCELGCRLHAKFAVRCLAPSVTWADAGSITLLLLLFDLSFKSLLHCPAPFRLV